MVHRRGEVRDCVIARDSHAAPGGVGNTLAAGNSIPPSSTRNDNPRQSKTIGAGFVKPLQFGPDGRWIRFLIVAIRVARVLTRLEPFFGPGDVVAIDDSTAPAPAHRLATASYLVSGAVTLLDSLGVEQVIRPGDVNWMTAGRGIAHSERFEDPAAFAGAGIELLQSWVALPEADEEADPAFDHYLAQSLPEAQVNGVWMRVIPGQAYGMRSPVRTHSPLFHVHAVMPIGERHIWWNFVSSRKDRIEQAKADWQAGRIALPPNDRDEFIPLP